MISSFYYVSDHKILCGSVKFIILYIFVYDDFQEFQRVDELLLPDEIRMVYVNKHYYYNLFPSNGHILFINTVEYY